MPVELERLSSESWAPPWVKHEHLARYLFARDLAEGRSVVDCACGDGTSSRLLGERADRVWGFDVSSEAITLASKVNGGGNIEYERADATDLSLATGTATMYVSLETIEHLPDVERFLEEAVRVLDRELGLFVCSTPDREVYSPGNRLEDTPWNSFHLREYSVTEFGTLLRRFFADVEMFGQNPTSPILTAMKHRAGRRLPGNTMVRVNQALKLPRLFHDRLEQHRVQPMAARKRYEYLVAVCRSTSPATER